MRNIPEERNSLTTLLNHPHFSTDVNNACRNTPTLIFMVKIKVAPVQSTKAHEGTGSTVPNIYNLDTIRRRVVSLRYHMLYPYKGPWYPLNWRLCRPYSRTVGCGEENISVPLQRTLNWNPLNTRCCRNEANGFEYRTRIVTDVRVCNIHIVYLITLIEPIYRPIIWQPNS